MTALSAISYFDRTALAIAAPALIREYGISEVEMGRAFSAFLISYTALMMPGGWLADRFGARIVLTFTALCVALFTGVTSAAGMAGAAGMSMVLIAIRFAMGAANAPLYPALGNMTAMVMPPERIARVQAIVLGGAAIGSAASPFLLSRLTTAYGWRASFWAAAGATAALALIWHLSTSRYNRVRASAIVKQKEQGSWIGLFKNRNLMLLSLGYACLNYFEYLFFYWIFYYFGQVLKLSETVAANASAILMLSMAVGSPAGGWAADRLSMGRGTIAGRRMVAATGMGLSALFLFLGTSGYGTNLTIAFLSLAFGLATTAEGPFWAMAMESASDQPGTAGGFMNTIGNVGGMIAPALTPVIARDYGWHASMMVGASVIFTGVLVWFFLTPSHGAQQELRTAVVS
ncbi:MAG: MFS transporter [Acidobacteriota bacterium]